MNADEIHTSHGTFVDAAYSDTFLAGVGKKFEFDALDARSAQRIRVIGRRYLADKSLDQNVELQREIRNDYVCLEKEVARFRGFIQRPEYENLASDIHFATLMRATESPKLQANDYSAKLDELICSLNLIRMAAETNIEQLAPERGRRPNTSLRSFVRRIADIWIDDLGRAFTYDAHRSAGLTRAFEFIHMLLAPLNATITETEIGSAMRFEQGRRIELKRMRKT